MNNRAYTLTSDTSSTGVDLAHALQDHTITPLVLKALSSVYKYLVINGGSDSSEIADLLFNGDADEAMMTLVLLFCDGLITPEDMTASPHVWQSYHDVTSDPEAMMNSECSFKEIYSIPMDEALKA